MRPSAALLLVALALVSAMSAAGCAGERAEAPRESARPASAAHRGRVSVVTFRGHIQLDPRAGYDNPEGDVWQHLYYLDGTLFDGLVCYVRAERCAVVDFQRGEPPGGWELVPHGVPADATPFVLLLDVPPDGDFRSAAQISLRVAALGLGEVGSTVLNRDDSARPPAGVRERLRAELQLKRIYEALAVNYESAPVGQRKLPESRSVQPNPPPCGPTWVRDRAALTWLGLPAPAVLSWSFGIEADASRNSVRVIARRDRNCHGDIESLVLAAHVDQYGDLERRAIESSP